MAPTEHGVVSIKKNSKEEEPTKSRQNKPNKSSSKTSLFSIFKKRTSNNSQLDDISNDSSSEGISAVYELLGDQPTEKNQSIKKIQQINEHQQNEPEFKPNDDTPTNNQILNTQDKPTLGTGVKFDENKLRYDLIPVRPMEQIAKVFTMGARKYKPRNWENGMEWRKPSAALERHYQAFKRGEDYDPESGLLHLAHVAVNAMFLMEYYNTFPQGDDRVLPYKKHPRIGLDIDEVLADFIGHYATRYELPIAESWNFDPLIKKRMVELADDKEFWLSVPVKTAMKDIPFEPVCYITSRKCPLEWTKEWLHKNGFANVPVYSSTGESKVPLAKENRLDWFIDDRYSNFVDLNENGICCFLFDAPHNKRYNVGYKRIFSLKDLPLF